MKSKIYSPMTARTIDQICTLRRDNADFGDYWILADGYRVTIAKQKQGKDSEARVTVPRAIFNKMVRFYTKPTRAKRKAL